MKIGPDEAELMRHEFPPAVAVSLERIADALERLVQIAEQETDRDD